MEPFTTFQGLVAPMMRADVDTDAIIPSREMTGTGRTGYGPRLFANWRYLPPTNLRREDPAFVLNHDRYRQAAILLAGPNFGCGSSREHATWALRQFGFRAVIAPSFATIFRNNCHRNGVLPVILEESVLQSLAIECEAGPLELSVSLVYEQVVHPDGRRWGFTVPARERAMMLAGLDEIASTLQSRASIERFRAADRLQRPWIYLQR